MKYDVYGIGNALVDMEFKVNDTFFEEHTIEKGLMTLVEEDRQEQLIGALLEHDQSEIKRQSGGSAANTIIAVSQFGGNAFYSCKVADDELGNFYLTDLRDNGVATKVVEASEEEGITGKCMVMVTPDAERTMNTYLGITGSLSEAQIDVDALKQSEWLYVEGYLVASPTAQAASLKAIQLAKEFGVKVSLTMSDPNMINFFKDNMMALIGDGVDLLFCNEQEAMDFTGKETVAEARESLKTYAKNFVITLGANGAMIWDGVTFVDIEPYQTKAIDSNGAGDMFAGAYLYGITNGLTHAGAGKLASLSSSKVVSQFGPRLAKEQAQELLASLS